MIKYSFVVPVLNEEEGLPELRTRLVALLEGLDGPSEVILVNDGSSDGSLETMVAMHHEDPRFKVVDLSRNFGHQLAITAGMDLAGGEAVVVLDADLQDPPEVVFEMIERWREGYEVVYAVRRERKGEGWFKKASAAGYYRILRSLTDVDVPVDTGDFRLLDRRVVEAYRVLPERQRFVRGIVSWLGFRQTGVPYVREPRHAGTTKYSFRKMAGLGLDGLFGFSGFPARFVVWQCALAVSVGFLAAGGALVWWIAGSGGDPVDGAGALLMAAVLLLIAGGLLAALAVVAEYARRTYEEARGRPLYIVRSLHGVSSRRARPGTYAVPDAPNEADAASGVRRAAADGTAPDDPAGAEAGRAGS